MRELGEQWVENGRMYKTVACKKDEPCQGCSFGYFDITPEHTRIHTCMCTFHCDDDGTYVIRDLGPVNEDVVLAEERTGLFPKISRLEIDDCVWVAAVHDDFVTVMAYGNTEQEAKDAWNRRN